MWLLPCEVGVWLLPCEVGVWLLPCEVGGSSHDDAYFVTLSEIKQRQQKGGLAVTNEGEGLAITNEEVVIQQDTVTQVGVVLGSAPGEGHPRRSLCGGVCCCKGSRKGSGSEDDSDSSDEDMFQRRGVGGDRSSVRKRKRKTKLKGQREGESSKPDRYQDELRSYFKNAGFDDADDPEKVAYLDYKPDLGNTKWVRFLFLLLATHILSHDNRTLCPSHTD